MDAQTDMILRMMSDMRAQSTNEANETRRQFNEGIRAITTRLDIANGRTGKLEQEVSRLDAVIAERTENMVCSEHAATFKHLEQSVADIKDDLRGRSQAERKPAVTAGGIAGSAMSGAMLVLYGVWQWWMNK